MRKRRTCSAACRMAGISLASIDEVQNAWPDHPVLPANRGVNMKRILLATTAVLRRCPPHRRLPQERSSSAPTGSPRPSMAATIRRLPTAPMRLAASRSKSSRADRRPTTASCCRPARSISYMGGNMLQAFSAVEQGIPTVGRRRAFPERTADPDDPSGPGPRHLGQSLKKCNKFCSARAGFQLFYPVDEGRVRFHRRAGAPTPITPRRSWPTRRSVQQGYVTSEPYAIET
jgi:hypothetical protein